MFKHTYSKMHFLPVCWCSCYMNMAYTYWNKRDSSLNRTYTRSNVLQRTKNTIPRDKYTEIDLQLLGLQVCSSTSKWAILCPDCLVTLLVEQPRVFPESFYFSRVPSFKTLSERENTIFLKTIHSFLILRRHKLISRSLGLQCESTFKLITFWQITNSAFHTAYA